MPVISRGLAALRITCISLGLVGTALGYALWQGTRPAAVTRALSQARTYQTIAPAVLANYAPSSFSIAGLSLKDGAVQTAARQAFSASYLQRTTQPALDTSLDWLRGGKAPDFTIDLSAGRQDLVQRLGQLLAQRYASKPDCSLAQLYNLLSSGAVQNLQQANDLPCRPPGLSQTDIQKLAVLYLNGASLSEAPEVLQRTAYRAQDITISGQPFYQSARLLTVRNTYDLIPIISWGCLGLALAAAVISLVRYGRRGGISLAAGLLGAAILSFLMALCLPWLYGQISGRFLFAQTTDTSAWQPLWASLRVAGQHASVAMGHGLAWLAALYALAGLALFVILKKWRPRTAT